MPFAALLVSLLPNALVVRDLVPDQRVEDHRDLVRRRRVGTLRPGCSGCQLPTRDFWMTSGRALIRGTRSCANATGSRSPAQMASIIARLSVPSCP